MLHIDRSLFVSRQLFLSIYPLKLLHNNSRMRSLSVTRHVLQVTFSPYRCNVREVQDPAQLYSDLMELIVRLANNGVIHSDFNEFNIMVNDEGKPTLIDFPQMVSTKHANAKM